MTTPTDIADRLITFGNNFNEPEWQPTDTFNPSHVLWEAAAEIKHLRKQLLYWHERYAEVARRRARLDKMNEAPLVAPVDVKGQPE